MTKLFKRTSLLALLLFFVLPSRTEVHASHYMGVAMQMECINACTSRVHWWGYRDCSSSNILSNTIYFDSPNFLCNPPTYVSGWQAQTFVEVTPVCASVQTQCINQSSFIQGVQEAYTYRDVDFCNNPPGCDYNIEWGSCCRNPGITSGSANQGQAIINYQNPSQGCNNSPVYTNPPLFYLCDGLATSVQMGGIDPDGDSLVYTLETCITDNNGVPVTYAPGYALGFPIGVGWTVAIDNASGLLTITPNPGGLAVGVLCITVTEYRNGVLISTNTRDILLTVINCSNPNAPVLGPVANLSPGATLTGSYAISACAGTPLCFDLEATDADTSSGQSVTLLWDGSLVGATFAETGNPTNADTITGNSPHGTFCWNNPVAGVYNVAIRVQDNACPIATFTDQVITIHVQAGPFTAQILPTAPDLDTCINDTITLSLPAPFTSYLWSNGATSPTTDITLPGTYMVTVTSPGCAGVGTGSVTIGTTANPDISGTVTLSNGSTPLANSLVYLITHDPILNALTAIDTTMTDTLGYYSFCNTLGADTVYLKAAPQLLAYPNHFPTYADTAIYWNNAVDFLNANVPLTVDWSVVPGSNPGGPGFIGGLISAGANKTSGVGDPVPDVRVFLFSTTSNAYFGTTLTDINGYFSFPALPYGDYEISVDVPGVDEVNVPLVSLGAQIPSLDSLDLRLHTTYLELVLPTSIPYPIHAEIDIYPNPSAATQTIAVKLADAQQIDIQLFDMMGREMMTVASGYCDSGERKFALSGLSAGTYFLQVRIGEVVQTFKVVHE